MIKPTLKSSWLLILFTLAGCIFPYQSRLNRMWPVKYAWSSPQALASVGEGYILKKNNDTLKGYIKMVALYYLGQTLSNVPLLPFDKKETADVIEVPLDDIDYVRIKWYFGHTDTYDYMPIGSCMWLIVGRKDQVRVCSLTWQDKYAANTDKMVIIEGKKTIEIPIASIGVWNPRSSYVRKFINKRYGQHFTKKDLKTETELINYILDQETK